MTSFTFPYLIQGKIYDSTDSPVKNATVTITNESTGDTQTTTTGSTGDYVFDCGNFTNGWTDGNKLGITATYSGIGTDIGESLRVKVVAIKNPTQIKRLEVLYT